MLRVFNLKKYPFEFNNETFYSFDKKYVPYLLGKHGNQTAINTAGSAWKKIIQRNTTEKQAKKTYLNPKWIELKNFLQGHLNLKSSLFMPEKSMMIKKLDDLFLSINIKDKQKLGEFLRFRELQRYNLVFFKKDNSFRNKVISEIFEKDWEFKRNILPQYIYILLVLYISRKYSIFDKYEYRPFANKICEGKEEYSQKFYDGLKSKIKLENLTSLCYTQYFWFDYRLASTEHSEIHLILYNMFNELKI
jgi:hypothetical protein